jgi:cytochrome c-type biogenesis protein CcmF
MIALGFIGDAFFKQETQGTLAVGQSLTISQYSLRFNGLTSYLGSDGREIVEAKTELFKNEKLVQALNPRRDFFTVQQQPVTIAGVHSTATEDVYVLLVGWEAVSNGASTFKIYLNPLINWVWIGGIVLMIGVLLAAWAQARGRSEVTYVLKQQQAEKQAGSLAGVNAVGD